MRPRDYLPPDLAPVRLAVVEAAHDDIGECEEPPGSNRGRYPDLVNQEFGSPLGSYWCANAVGHWWKKAGAGRPPVVGSTKSWLAWAKITGRFRPSRPEPGDAVLYGAHGVPEHIGIVARVVDDPASPGGRRVVTIEGNTSLGAYDRNGWIIDQKPETAARVIGYVSPTPLA